MTLPTLDMFLDGARRPNAAGCATAEVVNPATGDAFALLPLGGPVEVDAAVAAARRAFDGWSGRTGTERAAVLRRVAAGIVARKDELSRMETRDSGKPLKESEWDMDDAAACFEYFAEQAEKLDRRQGAKVELPDADFTCEMRYFATGVAAAVTPFNYPCLMAAWKAAPALAAGCTVVLKPSELTPCTSVELAAIAHEAGVPAGAFSVVLGAGETGALLVAHEGVDKVAFTGSVPTGARVAGAAARRVVPATLELGGKSPIVVFEDADLERAAEWAAFGAAWTNGQICSATSRLLVHESVAPRFTAALAHLFASIPVVNPCDRDQAEATGTIGPLVSRAQQQKVLAMIGRAVEQGARVLAGGGVPPGRERGFYVQPTLLEAGPGTDIWREEVFGPVLAVYTFRTEEEAVRLANDSAFGLAGAVMTADLARAARVANALRCGIAWINCSQPCFVQAPWGGCKRSGVGRELGERGIDNYLQPKQVVSHVPGADALGWYDMNGVAERLGGSKL